VKIKPDWRSAWRWYSMQAMALATALIGAWAALPDEWRQAVPEGLVQGITLVTLGLGMVGRLLTQEPPRQEGGDGRS
jgi:hypothetical protein